MQSTSTKPNVAKCFSKAAKTYDLHAAMHATIADKLLTFLPLKDNIQNNLRCLEIGCGTGILTKKILELIPSMQLLALDISHGMLGAAKDKIGDHANFKLMTADFLKFQEPFCFDLIASSAALHWIKPIEKTILKAYQYLNQNGKFLFSLMIEGTLPELHHSLAQTAPNKNTRPSLPKRKDILSALNAAKFKIINTQDEALSLFYPNAQSFISSLHEQGVNVTNRESVLTKQELKKLLTYYDSNYYINNRGIVATYNIMYCLAEKNEK